jgi:tyrosine-protein phosphatase YwqE
VGNLEAFQEETMNLLQRLFGGQGPDHAPFVRLGADVHSHLIPGIDDGSVSIEASLVMIRTLQGLGYRKIVTTPHVMSDAYKNSPDRIREGLALLRRAVQEGGIRVEIDAAAEYYLDDVFAQTMEERELLTFGGDKRYLLVETSYLDKPMGMNDVIFKLCVMGYIPVLAHPERYQYLWVRDAIGEVRSMKNRGMKIQVNLTSFGGRYSKMATSFACELAREELIDFIGTDLHRPTQLDTIQKTMQHSRELRQLVESGKLLNSSL